MYLGAWRGLCGLGAWLGRLSAEGTKRFTDSSLSLTCGSALMTPAGSGGHSEVVCGLSPSLLLSFSPSLSLSLSLSPSLNSLNTTRTLPHHVVAAAAAGCSTAAPRRRSPPRRPRHTVGEGMPDAGAGAERTAVPSEPRRGGEITTDGAYIFHTYLVPEIP
jgi:hypothetical protein